MENLIGEQLQEFVNLDARAPEILRWLLAGSLTLDELIEKRRKTYLNQCGRNYNLNYATDSILHDLNLIKPYIKRIDENTFSLSSKYLPAVKLYDKISIQSLTHFDAFQKNVDFFVSSMNEIKTTIELMQIETTNSAAI